MNATRPRMLPLPPDAEVKPLTAHRTELRAYQPCHDDGGPLAALFPFGLCHRGILRASHCWHTSTLSQRKMYAAECNSRSDTPGS
jgi:hypothetical protein